MVISGEAQNISQRLRGVMPWDTSLEMHAWKPEKARNVNQPDRHAEQHPSSVLLIALDGSAPPKRIQQVSLHYFDRLVPLGGYIERQLS